MTITSHTNAPSLRPIRATLLAALALLAVAPHLHAGQSVEVIAAFDSLIYGGASPNSPLLEAADGHFYGTTLEGGPSGLGTVFRLDRDGTLAIVHRFTGPDGATPSGAQEYGPASLGIGGGLMQAADGTIYGSTTKGGVSGMGTIYRLDVNGTFTSLYSFSGPDGATPQSGLTQGSDGLLYGTTYAGGANGLGTVFRMDALANLTTLFSFSLSTSPGGGYYDPSWLGVRPTLKLVAGPDGALYGVTPGSDFSGVLKVTPDGAVTRVAQVGAVVALTAGLDGNLYISNGSTIYRIGPDGTRTLFYSWSGTGELPRFATNLIQAADGSFYGMGAGKLFRVGAAGLSVVSDFPSNITRYDGGLMQARDGSIYGARYPDYTSISPDLGFVFRLDLSGTVEKVHQFGASSAGTQPTGLVQGEDGSLYGTTLQGGASVGLSSYAGTVFKIDPSGTLTTLHAFDGASSTSAGGNRPNPLVQGRNGVLYGMTKFGGPEGLGTVFRVTPSGEFATLHTFTAAEEGLGPTIGNTLAPRSALLQGDDGPFYGVTRNTIFRIDATGTLEQVARFIIPAGGGDVFPQTLTQGPDGRFYGVVVYGGPTQYGSMFAVDASGTMTTLHVFDGSDGAIPDARLALGRDGRLYGTTSSRGGTDTTGRFTGPGTVFAIDADGGFTTLHRFNRADGELPLGGLVEAPDGRLYGTTYHGGALNKGTVFAIDGVGNFTSVHEFSGADGALPWGDLILGRDGHLYGAASAEGPTGGGALYRIRLPHTEHGPTTIPGRIEAEDYDGGGPGVGYFDLTAGNDGAAYRDEDVDIKPSGDGGYAVGWFNAGEWLAYTVDAPQVGNYLLRVRVGSAFPDRTFHVEVDGDDATGPIAVPQFDDWDRYAIVTSGITFTAGRHVLRLVMGPDDFMDVDWIEVVSAPAPAHPILGRIEAEDYDAGGSGVGYVDLTAGNDGGAYRDEDVDIKPSGDGGYAVGWFNAGEWLAYTVDVTDAGTYALQSRIGSALPGRTFHVEVDGEDVSGPVAVPEFPDWDQYETVTGPGIPLTAGRHRLRVVMGPEDYMDFNWLELTRID